MKNLKPFNFFSTYSISEGRNQSTSQVSYEDLLAESDAEEFELMEALLAEDLFEDDLSEDVIGDAALSASKMKKNTKPGKGKKTHSKKEASDNIDQRLKETDAKAKEAAEAMGIKPSTEFNKLIELHKNAMKKLKDINNGSELDPEVKMKKVKDIEELKTLGKSINVVLSNMGKRAEQHPFYYQSNSFKETLKKLVAISMAVQAGPGQSAKPQQVPTKNASYGITGILRGIFGGAAGSAYNILAGIKGK